ncbi:polysaccharide deacetylase family protein [Dermabacteraceae bacterium P7074]
MQSDPKSSLRPGRRAVITAAGTGLVATACSSGGDGKKGSTQDGGLFSSAPEPTPAEAYAAFLDELASLNDKVPNLATGDLAKTPAKLAISFPTLPAAYNFALAADIVVAKTLREHAYLSDAPALGMTGKIITVGKSLLGSVLVPTLGGKADGACVYYYDATRDRAYASTALVTGDKWADFTKAVSEAAADVDGLDAEQIKTLVQEQQRPYGNGPSLVVAADGTLTTLFPAVKIGDETGPAKLTIEAAKAEALLSNLGKAVKASMANPEQFEVGTVERPGDGKSHNGDRAYKRTAKIHEGKKAREATGPGPVTQLAPLSGEGVRPSIVVGPDTTRLKAVSLSFDDGPDPQLNIKLVEMLTKAKAACSFYNIGRNAKAYPESTVRTVVAGQELGCHSWSHPQLTRTNNLHRELVETSELVGSLRGSWPLVMRPPYGARNDRIDDEIRKLHQSIQLWDVDTEDWRYKSVPHNVDSVKNMSRRGSIILMHEIHAASVESVPQILQWFEEQGFTTVTNGEVGQGQMYPGYYYTHGLDTNAS